MPPTYWRRVPSSRCRSFRFLTEVSPKMVEEVLYTQGRAFQQNSFCCVFGFCHSNAKISCGSGANGIQKIASFKQNTEYQVLLMQSSQQGVRLGTTGCISQVASLTAPRPCTMWYSPLGFFIGKMGVLQADWHGPIRPWSFRFCVTEVMPNKASRQREGLILYWIMFVLS